MESTQRMLETGVASTWIDDRCQSQLADAIQSLKKRVLHNAVEQSARHLDKSEYWIVDYL